MNTPDLDPDLLRAFVAVAATAVAAIVGFAVHRHLFTPGMAIGPALGAAVAVAVVVPVAVLRAEAAVHARAEAASPEGSASTGERLRFIPAQFARDRFQ